MDNIELAAALRELAEDHELLYTVARRKIEDALVEFRDAGISFPFRNNGLVIKYRDGSSSDIIRLGPEDATRIALEALAEHIENEESNDQVV